MESLTWRTSGSFARHEGERVPGPELFRIREAGNFDPGFETDLRQDIHQIAPVMQKRRDHTPDGIAMVFHGFLQNGFAALPLEQLPGLPIEKVRYGEDVTAAGFQGPMHLTERALPAWDVLEYVFRDDQIQRGIWKGQVTQILVANAVLHGAGGDPVEKLRVHDMRGGPQDPRDSGSAGRIQNRDVGATAEIPDAADPLGCELIPDALRQVAMTRAAPAPHAKGVVADGLRGIRHEKQGGPPAHRAMAATAGEEIAGPEESEEGF